MFPPTKKCPPPRRGIYDNMKTDAFNAWLGERCRALWNELRHPDHRQFSIAEVLKQERADMMLIPAPFDGYVERDARVTSTCLARVARNHYSAPCEFADQRVSARLYYDQVVIAADHAIVATHARLPERDQIG